MHIAMGLPGEASPPRQPAPVTLDIRNRADAAPPAVNSLQVAPNSSPQNQTQPSELVVVGPPKPAVLPDWIAEPIGLPIEYNPYANGESPSRRLYSEVTVVGTQPAREPTQLVVRKPTARSAALFNPIVKLAKSRSVDDAATDAAPSQSETALQASAISNTATAGALASNQFQSDFTADTVAANSFSAQPAPQPSQINAPAPTSDEQQLADAPFLYESEFFFDHGVLNAAFQQPLAPLQPLQPVQPPSINPFEPSITSSFNTLGMTSIAELAAAAGGGPAQGVGARQAQSLAPTDIGGLLQNSSSVQSVNTTRRSPVALAPNVRGYQHADIYAQATGAYWFPVREDLDSMLSKIDPGMIQEVVVIPGPYGVRYGPGLSFIDIETADTPRYDDGYGSDYRANGNIRTNGGELYGRLTADGGNDDYGYRISYGHRKGSDYAAGNDLLIPSSYDNGDVWAQYGFNITKYQKVEASYLRLDQGETQYAAQFFDVDSETTDGGTLRWTDEDPTSPWSQFVMEGWWNRTFFNGSITPNKSRPTFPVITRVEFALDQEIGGTNTVNGDTLGSNVSSGARAVMRFGDVDDQYIRVGADFHFLQQGLRENYDITNSIPPLSLGKFFTNQPFSTMQDEGLFAEYRRPINDSWNVTLGSRVDWVYSDALLSDLRPDTNLDPDLLAQHDELYSYYLTNEYSLTDRLKLNVGYGYAQRPPALVERYADGVFLGLLQSGFTRVIGEPTLRPERDFQIDVGLTETTDNFRASATYFYAWVVDYITFEGDAVVNFFDAKLVRYTNTPLATLTGFETAEEYDLASYLTPFAKMKYVQGQNETLGGPLPGIPPLEGTVGFRLHDSCKEEKWEFEIGTRVVNQQARVGEILILNTPTVVEERTGGFTTSYVRASYNWSKDFHLVAGIDNMFNRSYQEHLDLRLLGPTGFPAPPTRVLSPGITPYFGLDWTF